MVLHSAVAHNVRVICRAMLYCSSHGIGQQVLLRFLTSSLASASADEDVICTGTAPACEQTCAHGDAATDGLECGM